MVNDSNVYAEALGIKLRDQFTKVKSDRVEIERRWLDDLRQFKGVYSAEELLRMDPARSHTFARVTRTKVKSATARLMDMVFPAGSDDNWSYNPTPKSEMAPDPAMAVKLMAQLGRQPTKMELDQASQIRAAVAAKNMEKTVRDQLVEVRYRKLVKQAIFSGNLFGTGIIKGPLVNRSYRKAWTIGPDGSWKLNNIPRLIPFTEFTPVWEMYPDTLATTFLEAQFNYQRSVMPKHEVSLLAKRPDFKKDAIRSYLKDNPDGDATMLDWEVELRRLGWNLTGNQVKGKRYEVLEYWGVLDAKELTELGIEVPDDSLSEFWANVWLLGSKIIKVDVQPIEGMQLPYYAYYWDKDETSIFGEGIPSIMRDEQKALNSAVRAMQDNAAITAGPQLEANIDLLHPDEDSRSVHPFKVWQRTGVGAEAQYPALREVRLSSYTQEYLQLAGYFMNNIHELTLPSYMHGEATSKGSVGRTASGLSMLMSAAQITFKDQLFSIDDDLQKPLLEGFYHWNMQFNPDPDIKGDFDIVVKGTSSLVAREIRAQNLDQFANSTLNPMDAPFIDRHALNKQRALVLELGDDIIRDKDQAFYLMAQALAHGDNPTGPQAGAQPSPQGGSANLGFPGMPDVSQAFQSPEAGPPGGSEFGAAGPGAEFAGQNFPTQ